MIPEPNMDSTLVLDPPISQLPPHPTGPLFTSRLHRYHHQLPLVNPLRVSLPPPRSKSGGLFRWARGTAPARVLPSPRARVLNTLGVTEAAATGALPGGAAAVLPLPRSFHVFSITTRASYPHCYSRRSLYLHNQPIKR